MLSDTSLTSEDIKVLEGAGIYDAQEGVNTSLATQAVGRQLI